MSVSNLLSVFVLISLLGCSTFHEQIPKNSHKVTLSNEAQVTFAAGDPKKYSAGESIIVSEPAMIESEGHVGVLVLPPQTSSNYNLQLKPIREWGGASYKKQLNAELSTILVKINDIQVAMGKGQFTDAISKVQNLKAEYPQLGYLNYLESSCYLAQGDRAKAKSLLNEGLLQELQAPTGEEFKRFVNSVKGVNE